MAIQGLDALQKKLDKLADNKTYYKALGRAGIVVEGAAIRLVPVDTGLLRGSIATNVKESSLTAQVGTNLEYAPYVEYGTGLFATGGYGRQTPWSYQREDGSWVTTRGQRAQPFLGPALRENREKVVKEFQRTLNEVIK